MSQLIDLRKQFPLVGFWLYDAGPRFSNLYFNLTKSSAFPEVSFVYDPTPEVRNILNNFYLRNLDTFDYSAPSMDITDKVSSGNFFKILNAVRNFYRKKHPLGRYIPSLRFIPSAPTSAITDPQLHSKRSLFLQIAMELVAGSGTIEQLADKYHISFKNIRIWTSIFLNHGTSAFFNNQPAYAPDMEDYIIDFAIKYDYPIHKICGIFRIYSYNSYRRIRHRSLLRRARLQSEADWEED